jgi:ketosteroid isomerase-like protein
MKFTFAAAALMILSLSSLLRAQSLDKEILARETQVWKSFVGPYPNAEAFQAMITPDYLCVEPTGILVNGAENVAELKRLTFSSFQILDPHVRSLSRDSAFIVARVRYEGTFDGQNISAETLSSTVWVKRNGKWLAQLHTETFKK